MGKFIYYFLELIEKNYIMSNNNKIDEKSRLVADIRSLYLFIFLYKNC